MPLRPRGLPRPPSGIEPQTSRYLSDLAQAVDGLPLSYFSTTDGPNSSNETAPRGTLGIEIGDSSGTVLWSKQSGQTATQGWKELVPNPYDGTLFVGDTSNGQMTKGITVNQGAADDEAFALKSSDVNHSFTGFAEADTYAAVIKSLSNHGGVLHRGYTTGNIKAVSIEAHVGGTPETTKGTTGQGSVHIDAFAGDGSTGRQALGTDENVLSIANGGTTRFIFDAEGSGHADVEWTTFDEHDDLQIIEDIEAALASGTVEREFGDVVRYDREFLEREGLLNDVRETGNGKMRGMMNWTKMLMLHSGALRQVGAMARAIAERLSEVEAENAALRAELRSALPAEA